MARCDRCGGEFPAPEALAGHACPAVDPREREEAERRRALKKILPKAICHALMLLPLTLLVAFRGDAWAWGPWCAGLWLLGFGAGIALVVLYRSLAGAMPLLFFYFASVPLVSSLPKTTLVPSPILPKLVPSLILSKQDENESSAIASLKTLVTAEEQFKATGGTSGYGTLSQLMDAMPPYIDAVLERGKKAGYSFVLVVGKPASSNYYATAWPVIPGKTGNRRFFVDSSCVIRYCARKGGSATSGDSPIE